MKIRTDFVTNSSSSSFVIAINIEAKREDIKKALEKQDFVIKWMLEDGLEDFFSEEEINLVRDEKFRVTEESIRDYLAGCFLELSRDAEINKGYRMFIKTGYTDANKIFSVFLSQCKSAKDKNFIIKNILH